jgi:hypothetical protein
MAMLDDALTDLRQTIAASATRSRSKIALSPRPAAGEG